MAVNVTIRKTDGTIVTQTVSFYGGARPNEADYVKLTVSGSAGWYTVRWVAWETDPLTGGSKVTIGAALPSDPSPPPPT